MIYAENQPCTSKNCDSWLKVRRRPAGWKPSPEFKYQYAVWYVCKHGHTHFNDADKRYPEQAKNEKPQQRLFAPREIVVKKPAVIVEKPKIEQQTPIGPAQMTATEAARRSAGRHLLTNLMRAKFVPPIDDDEDLSETTKMLDKKKQRAIKRKQAKTRKQVSA